MNFRRLAILAVMDVLLLIELTLGIWWSHFDRAEIAWRFSQLFVPCALLTVLTARLVLRRWAPEPPPAPGERPCRPVGLFGALDSISDLSPGGRG
jgi:hypothetical protein